MFMKLANEFLQLGDCDFGMTTADCSTLFNMPADEINYRGDCDVCMTTEDLTPENNEYELVYNICGEFVRAELARNLKSHVMSKHFLTGLLGIYASFSDIMYGWKRHMRAKKEKVTFKSLPKIFLSHT